LDRAFPSLTSAEELVVARSATASGPVARAITAYQRSLTAPGASPADQLAYGQLLVRAGRHRDAITALGKITTPKRIAAEAAYQRARAMLLSGNGTGARAALQAAANKFASEAEGAAAALYLLADLATDDGRDADARKRFRELYAKYPRSARADDARFRAAMIDYVNGDFGPAAMELDSLVTASPRAGEAMAARYWSGRAWEAKGDTARARARWRDVISREPISYYAGVSARQLDTATWAPPGGPASTDTFPRVPGVDSAMRRIELLEQLGMDVEAGFEYTALESAASGSPARLLATANALRAHGQTSRSIRLAWKLIEGGQRDARAYRLAYPVVDQAELARQAKARSLEPALVAALIRQESSFNPRAVSVAGARGLMQVMPAVGQQVARSLGYPVWDPVLLFEPDANLELGTAHLAAFMKQYDGLVRTLAAYNAGGSRVERWKAKSGTDDPEIFAERIPFTETRDYVRIVQRNRELYDALYDWK
jgi:soluble lytic murein transglycosylase